MHISDAPLSQRKEDGGWGGEGTKAKLKIKWCDLHYKSITLWHLHIVYLCNSKIFFFPQHLPISVWACINMYKSLLGKKIESLALHWKVWRVHFLARTSSLAPVRAVSNICWGCFLPACPNKRRRLQALCSPAIPQDTHLPTVQTSGERDPGSRLGHGFGGGGSRAEWRPRQPRVGRRTSLWIVESEVCHDDCQY